MKTQLPSFLSELTLLFRSFQKKNSDEWPSYCMLIVFFDDSVKLRRRNPRHLLSDSLIDYSRATLVEVSLYCFFSGSFPDHSLFSFTNDMTKCDDDLVGTGLFIVDLRNATILSIIKDAIATQVTVLYVTGIMKEQSKFVVAMFASNKTMSDAPFTALIDSSDWDIKNYDFKLSQTPTLSFVTHTNNRWNKIGIVVAGERILYLVFIDAELYREHCLLLSQCSSANVQGRQFWFPNRQGFRFLVITSFLFSLVEETVHL
jgi:hypothetical protein